MFLRAAFRSRLARQSSRAFRVENCLRSSILACRNVAVRSIAVVRAVDLARAPRAGSGGPLEQYSRRRPYRALPPWLSARVFYPRSPGQRLLANRIDAAPPSTVNNASPAGSGVWVTEVRCPTTSTLI